ncbi:Chitin binding Peritrophin-A domain containing protein [Euroglyphus maynei]|uniref:Chitin binding Peritrophin-A domain containing protein n=2 Tax=Pyroglyphidae TaxID=6952 RepID=A0A1Y3B060_EURMA|nr:Chitin binding Peritrophin-A domain containing protein [Euroglyphus maynei]
MPDKSGIPESACTRPGIFQHPNDCNKYYECYWDKHINKFTLHPFECPVKLAFDSRIIGCASPNDPTVCVQY